MSDLIGEPIAGECGELLNKYFLSDFRSAYKRYRGVCLPSRHDAFAQRVENMEVRDDDIWVVSYPKTGTTWTQEMIWCLAKDLAFEAAKEPLPSRFPFLEHSCLFDYGDVLPRKPGLKLQPFVEDSVEFVNNLKSPRFIKTHLPWSLLPASIRNGQKHPKIVYVCRNPKDTCVSYYHHCILLEGYKGNFSDFCKLFLEDCLCFSPFWSHIEGFWKRRDQPNVVWLKYEDMKKDLPGVIREMAEFLGKQLNQKQLDILCDHLSFSSMKNNPSVNYEAVVEINRTFNLIPAEGEFMRKGTGGEWKEKMSEEMIEKFDKWTEEHLMRTGIQILSRSTDQKMDANRCLDDRDPDFKYKFSNDSHSWILSYPESLKPDPKVLKISSKNEAFTQHELLRENTKGKRKKLMEAFYRQVITEDIIEQLEDEGIVIEDYTTDYMERFKNPDDLPLPGETLSRNEKLKKENGSESSPNEESKESKLEQLKAKYPLYFSEPLTFFSQTSGRSHFRKNSTITRSPDQNYDNKEY